MPGGDDSGSLKTDELTEVIREIRERVRARYPGEAGGLALPDLMPLLRARDLAEAKVASIGTVNPRPPGLINTIIQAAKKLVARLLDWHVREQVEFNRGVMVAVEAIIEALNENNRALARLARSAAEMEARSRERLDEFGKQLEQTGKRLEERMEELRIEAAELKDIRAHWAEWRQEWERKLSVNEVQFLRGVADLQSAFQHRATLMESNFREMVKSQHADFTGALERSGLEIQKRLWADLEKTRGEFERLIHTELRLIRQRAAHVPVEPAYPAPPAPAAAADWGRFAERFRGSEAYVEEKQKFYLPYFTGRGDVLDLGCGRGEFLELLKANGVGARGVDRSGEMAAVCRSKGLEAECADLFSYLAALPDLSLDGVFCAQVVEHLAPELVPELIRLAAAKLGRNGILVVETPNPECLAIFATHFYLDPTHTRPLPAALLRFYMEECGLGRIETHPLSPATDTMPSLASLPKDFREAFFGGLDYAIIGVKL